MADQFLEYALRDGFIDSWLVAGPQAVPIQEALSPGDHSQLDQIFRRNYDAAPGVPEQPVDRDTFEIGGEKYTWRYYRCHEDHLVNVCDAYPLPHLLRAWAYTRLVVPLSTPVTFLCSTNGPFDLWLNGKHLYRKEEAQNGLQTASFQAGLERENELLIRFEGLGLGETALQAALRLVDLPESVPPERIVVRLPTRARFPLRQQMYERVFEKAYLEEVVNYRGAHFNLRWAEDTGEELRFAYQVQDDQERIYVEGTWDAGSKDPQDVGHLHHLFERPYRVVLRAPGREYYDQNLRYQRSLPIHILDTPYSYKPYGSPAQRRQEALENAAKREGHLFAEIAKMILGRWEQLDQGAILEAVGKVQRGEIGSEALLTGFLGILYRFSEAAAFPPDLKALLEDGVLQFRWTPLGFPSALAGRESAEILRYTCEILAGQKFPDRNFASSGQTGSQLRDHGETLGLDWLRTHGQKGFAGWDSNCAFEQVFLALSHLGDLAENEPVRELAAVLMDKLLFLMAVNSYHGAYGTTHGSTCASMLKSAQLEATSGMMRMLWGVGVFNHHILGTVSLACSNYEYPAFFAEIAARPPDEMWSKECQVFDGEVNKVTYKTPDFLLSSAQDFRPGEKGSRAHIWQATFGPDALVFANHPAGMSEGTSQWPTHQPGFWMGNAVLPRVVQWKDVLIAVHRLPEDDWLGFTHAFFPYYAFDEVVIEDGWAFARKGKGYLAITARQGIELIKRGPDGYRELRSYGRENIWLCHLGREAMDGYFQTFIRDILEIRPKWGSARAPLSVRFTSLRKETLSFGWEGSFTINGKKQPITGFKHIENPYCTAELPAKQMDITFEDVVLRLNFS